MILSNDRLETIRKNHYDRRMGNCRHIDSVMATDKETEEMAKELQSLRKEIDRVAVFLAVHNVSGYTIIDA